MRVQIAHTSVARNKANASADSARFTTPLTRTTQLRCGKPRTVATDAARVKQVEMWLLEKCDWRIKAWEAREIQLEVRASATRECLPKSGARLKHDRIDDDAEDERNEEGLRDCSFPQYYANPGVSPLMRRTERDVRRDSCDKVHIVFTEGDDIHVLCATVSLKTARRRVVQTSSRVMCDSYERSVSSVQGCMFSDSGQSQFQREQFIRTGCLLMTGIERWESHECNKPGQLRKYCSVCKKRIAEKGNKPKGKRVETTAVVQGVMVETLVYDDGMLIESRSGFVSESTTRGTTPPLFLISGFSIEQRGYREVHWKGRGLNTLVESSRLVPDMSV